MKRAGNFIDVSGKVFNFLTAIEIIKKPNNKRIFWKCICKCGKETIVDSAALRSGHTKSCGCYKIDEATIKINFYRLKRILPEGESAFNDLFYVYNKNAKNRNLIFELSRDQFRFLTKQNCYYCSCEPKQEHLKVKTKKRKGYIYNGIDRLDNNLGYTLKNSVSCCGLCNQMKMNETLETFLSQVEKIYNKKIKIL